MAFRVISRKNRLKYGGGTVVLIAIFFVIVFMNQPSREYGPSLFTVDIFKDPVKESLPFYEALADENCVNVINEHIPAELSKAANKKSTNPLDAPLIQASAPKCKAVAQRPVDYQKLGKDGFVTLSINVNKEGVVERGEIEKTSGFADLDEVALKNVTENWQFEPCKKLDKVVSCKQKIKYRWKLADN